MTRLLLIRHGETEWNREERWQGHADVPLSDAGRRQAAALATRLADREIAAVYSSDLERALETAQVIARPRGLEPIADRDLREIDLGTWSGLQRDEIRERYAGDWARIVAGEDIPRGGAETLALFSARVGRALERIRWAHPAVTVAVATHGGVIRVAIARSAGLPLARLREIGKIANTETIELESLGERWTLEQHAADRLMSDQGKISCLARL